MSHPAVDGWVVLLLLALGAAWGFRAVRDLDRIADALEVIASPVRP